MRKILSLMTFILPLVFISCNDDKEEPEPPMEHKWVDLGLPSGTLWATCNIGANEPEGYGDYFAWGETEPKDTYEWENYNGPNYSEFSDTDNKTELNLKDDAAYVNWGSQWRMPTDDQFHELFNSCSWRWTQLNGVKGLQVKGPNGNTLFLPAAGIRVDGFHWHADTSGFYRTLTRYPSNFIGDYRPVHLEFASDDMCTCNNLSYLFYGLTVRPVRVSKD